MKEKLLLILTALLLLTGCNSEKEVRHADWIKFRGAFSNGITDEAGWNPKAIKKPEILWKAKIRRGYSAPSVKGDYVYIAGNSNITDTFYCLNIADGSVKWKYTYDYDRQNYIYPGPRSS